jgi:hypothetical protein
VEQEWGLDDRVRYRKVFVRRLGTVSFAFFVKKGAYVMVLSRIDAGPRCQHDWYRLIWGSPKLAIARARGRDRGLSRAPLSIRLMAPTCRSITNSRYTRSCDCNTGLPGYK